MGGKWGIGFILTYSRKRVKRIVGPLLACVQTIRYPTKLGIEEG